MKLCDDKTPSQTTGKFRAPDRFVETRWSQVLLAGHGDSSCALKAKEYLCAAYWPPIYSFLRRQGHTPHDSEDLTQQFFVRLQGSNAFSGADRSKGRFRNFLLGALKHFLVDEARKCSAQKRGGKTTFLPIDLTDAEEGYVPYPDPGLTPEQVYDRRWAATVLDQAFKRLRVDFETADQLDRFELLKSFLSEEAGKGDYDRLARQLGMTPKAVSVAVCRLRQRYRQLVREMVTDTLAVSEDTDKELRDLFG